MMKDIGQLSAYAQGQEYAMTGKKSEIPGHHNPFVEGSYAAKRWWDGFRDECSDASDSVCAILNSRQGR